MRPLIRFIAAGMLAIAAFSANAGTVAYGEAFDTLYRIDLDSRQASAIGSAGMYSGQTIGNISGLTTSMGGALYAIAGGFKLLLKIDPTGGAGTVIGGLGLSGQGGGQFDALDLGMAFSCDGTLWLSSGVLQKLWKVDPKTGATLLVGSTGHAIAGLASRAGILYGSGSRGDHGFYRIDMATGTATPIGDFGAAASDVLNSVAMAFDDAGTLWAVLNYVPPTTGSVTPDWSDLATIDPTTGAMTLLGPITGPDSLRQIGMKGLTIGPTQCDGSAVAPNPAPIGSPWALALLGLLLAGAGLVATRRQLHA
ncbi:MAG: hypothetical protein ACHP7D_05460 [Lysobacterales bacterium]